MPVVSVITRRETIKQVDRGIVCMLAMSLDAYIWCVYQRYLEDASFSTRGRHLVWLICLPGGCVVNLSTRGRHLS